jgi:undecaprenyl-diphosphatase
LSRDNPAPAAPLALGGGWIGALSRASMRLDQELFERAARRPSPLLDRAMPRRTRRADHGVLWMAIACGLALVGGPRCRHAARTGLVAVAATSALANQFD